MVRAMGLHTLGATEPGSPTHRCERASTTRQCSSRPSSCMRWLTYPYRRHGMRAIRKILVGVRDPKAKQLPAVEKAAQLALAFGAQLELFHALSMPSYLGLDAWGPSYLPELQRAHRA